MRVQIDIPVFSSPTQAFGNASGEIEVSEAPKQHAAFPWPLEWITEHPAYFAPEQSLASVAEFEGKPLVMLYGIVCESVDDARTCAAFLEDRGGLFFDEYDHHPAGEA